MRLFTRMLLLAALLLLPAPFLLGQTAVDPSGHWEGTVQIPNMELKIEIDLAKNSKGELAGTFGNPTQEREGPSALDCGRRGPVGPLRAQGR